MTTVDIDLGNYELGWADEEDYVFKPEKGLNEELIRTMSSMKKEPEWMLNFRLKAYKRFLARPTPTWGGGGRLDSIDYDDATGRQVFYHHNRMCSEVDVVLAFIPEASMGTAIEMWEAYQNGRAVIAISPLSHNWAIKYCSHHIYPDFNTFEQSLVSGHLAETIGAVLA